MHLQIKELEDVPDLFVFNFQEIVPLNAKSMIINSMQPQLWEKYLLQELNAFLQEKLKDKLPFPNFLDKIASHG